MPERALVDAAVRTQLALLAIRYSSERSLRTARWSGAPRAVGMSHRWIASRPLARRSGPFLFPGRALAQMVAGSPPAIRIRRRRREMREVGGRAASLVSRLAQARGGYARAYRAVSDAYKLPRSRPTPARSDNARRARAHRSGLGPLETARLCGEVADLQSRRGARNTQSGPTPARALSPTRHAAVPYTPHQRCCSPDRAVGRTATRRSASRRNYGGVARVVEWSERTSEVKGNVLLYRYVIRPETDHRIAPPPLCHRQDLDEVVSISPNVREPLVAVLRPLRNTLSEAAR